MLNVYENVKIEKYNQIGEPSKGWAYEHITPTDEAFQVIGKGCNYYGNPTFHVTFDNEEIFNRIASVPSRERSVAVYKKGYISFTSYNVGMTLEKLFKKCGIAEMMGLEN